MNVKICQLLVLEGKLLGLMEYREYLLKCLLHDADFTSTIVQPALNLLFISTFTSFPDSILSILLVLDAFPGLSISS